MSMIRTSIDLVSRSVRRHGFARTLTRIPFFLGRQWRLGRFDRRYGTNTTEVRVIDQDEVIGDGAGHSSTHMPTPQDHFDRALEALPAPPRDLVFIDIGSGMGRAVLYASLLPFKRVIGIEFSRTLHEVAVKNVEIFRRKNPGMCPVELVCADALAYELPREDTLLFFHQPFDFEMFERMIQRVAHSLEAAPRVLFLVYLEPRHQAAVDNSGLFQLLESKGEAGEPDGAWRIWRAK
jgi:hypothetical protein